MLKGTQIRKSLGGEVILKGLDIEVERGKIVAIIGPSGAGKSTLLRALSMLDPPSTGHVMVDDLYFEFPAKNGTHHPPPWPSVTVVFQQLFLWPHLTLRENILLPVKHTLDDATNQYYRQLIDMLDLHAFIDRHPNSASIGQRQRVALARALMLRPNYLLLDEITSSLDVEQISAVLGHLQDLRNDGMGILIVTHLLGFARNAADEVAFLEDGRILESAGPELLDQPKNDRVRKFLSLVKSAR